jgi:5-formyltetrahydrofolate cyclo-ligase
MEEQIRQEKDRLRWILREETQKMPDDYIRNSNRGIRDRLLALNLWKQARFVFIYVSMNREPDTRTLIQTALDEGKTVAVPRCLEDGEMEARIITSTDELHRGRYGILEPEENGIVVYPLHIDLIVAPCIAADRQGYRLGHGGGYYDRYLVKTGCDTVCLCRERLLQDELPHGAFDHPVDTVITEQECIVFG